jgi:hypothetical protein
MGIMQSLILWCALGISKIAERTRAQDGRVEGKMELGETLGRAIFFTLVLLLRLGFGFGLGLGGWS